MMTRRYSFWPAVVVLLAFSGCVKRSTGPAPAPPPPDEKRSAMSRIFSSGSATVGYGWDGQMSSTSVRAPVGTAFTRCVEVLRNLSFVLKTEETRREGASAHITAVKADKTAVLIQLSEKSPDLTEVRARVGAVGDRTGSERILDELHKNMQKAGPPPAKTSAPPPPAPPPAPKAAE